MFPTSDSVTCARHAIPGKALILLIAFLAIPAQAQIGGTGIDEDPASGMRRGTNTITGQVKFPSGRTSAKRLTVRLSSVVVGEFSTMTDDNGVFTFRRLRDGRYFITVEAGKEYFPAQETVDLFDNRGRTTTVQIDLRPRSATGTKAGVINAALAGIPRRAVELYENAQSSAKSGDVNKAIEQLQEAIAIHPQFIVALNEMSVLYVYLGDLTKAGDALVQAIRIAPNDFTLRLNYGYVLMQAKRFSEAETELARATELNPTSAIANLYRGRVLIALRKYVDAEKTLQRVTSLKGAHVAMAHRYLGGLYAETGDDRRALESLEKYLILEPKAKDVDEVRKIVEQIRGRLAKAGQ